MDVHGSALVNVLQTGMSRPDFVLEMVHLRH